MPRRPFFIYFSPRGQRIPECVSSFAERTGHEVICPLRPAEVLDRVSRAFPSAIIIDGVADADGQALQLCRTIKGETFTGVVPVIVHLTGATDVNAAAALEAGADEVLTISISDRECDLRLELALRRAERDVSVHPTTRLPGTVQIERDLAERVERGSDFAVCYADLDHFKEFNDRYGYNHGDRVILILSKILRDVVRAHASTGFVGHIGGDDFIFSLPLEQMSVCCKDILETFDTLIPFQYTPEDRARGYFFGKDRRGEGYAVPLMTLSIGVVTNERRDFRHPAQISELATEMKAYAKTLPGSVYAVDRRGAGRGECEEPA